MKGAKLLSVILIISFFSVISGCQSVYYAAWEKLGKEKRHLLKDQIRYTRSDQKKAQKEFKDALTRIKEIYGFHGGNLENFYVKLKSDYENCEKRANTVHKRIAKVERIAKDLFNEWENELNQMKNPKLKADSRKSLAQAKMRYAKLDVSMKKAEASMAPVLKNLHDYLLYMKHNLNAAAIGALKNEAADIEISIGNLIKDMNHSINEAENFLKNF